MKLARTKYAAFAASAALAVSLLFAHHPIMAEPALRTAYVTVADGRGAWVEGLAAADITVKEGGKDREIVKIEVSTTPMRIALLVEDSLTGDAATRQGLFQFIKKLQGKATFAIFLVGRRNVRAIDYTSDVGSLNKAIDAFPSRKPTFDENLVEGIVEASQDLSRQESGRLVIVAVATERMQSASISPDRALDELRKSNAMFYAATLASGINTSSNLMEAIDNAAQDKVLSDGTKQSGGSLNESLQTSGIPAVLERFANELLHQYAVTYLLPEGVKPDSRLSIKATRKGISVRAPTDVPDR
jgi:VWFA-related protein